MGLPLPGACAVRTFGHGHFCQRSTASICVVALCTRLAADCAWTKYLGVPMHTTTHDIDLEQLIAEHHTLLGQYARVQEHCSDLLLCQAAEIAHLQALLVRQRGQAIASQSALAWAREDRAELQASILDLPRRTSLLQEVKNLTAQVQALMHERLRWRWGDAAQHAVAIRSTGTAALPSASAATNVVQAHGLSDPAGLEEAADDIAQLEASLVAADLVICQTGCLSHGAYWRVQDHCKRTGKACVVVEQPEAVRIVRIHQPESAPVPQEIAVNATQTTGVPT